MVRVKQRPILCGSCKTEVYSLWFVQNSGLFFVVRAKASKDQPAARVDAASLPRARCFCVWAGGSIPEK